MNDLSYIKDSTLYSIAGAIRTKTNQPDTKKYKPKEMAEAILSIDSFTSSQKINIIEALAQKGVYVNLDEITLDNIATYILQIKVDSNIEEYITLQAQYNELITYSQNQLNIINITQNNTNLYPNIDSNKDIVQQTEELKQNYNDLVAYLIEKLKEI